MQIMLRTFGPRYGESDRDIYGRANNTGHGGCWIHELACDAPDCIMAELDGAPVLVERRMQRLFFRKE